VMPVSYIGFTLKPVGFFDRNPALDVPPPEPRCCHDRTAESDGPSSLTPRPRAAWEE
jgi:primary-amine oxidase